MSTITSTPTSSRRRPLAALAKAEYLQFKRNTTLVVMGVGFPVLIPLVTFFITRKTQGATAELTATTIELFALMALLFVQFYSVLSMVTTRRSEGVLKRLRTGEAKDWQIQVAPMVPGAVLTAVGLVVVSTAVFGAGAPLPVNPVLVVAAVAVGIAIFSLFALATSALTKNAEAAQITSMPVMAIAFLGLSSIRGLFSDGFAKFADRTPFAALSDLLSLGSTGKLATAPDGTSALDFAATWGAAVAPLAILAAWTILALVLTRKYFRWDDRG